MHENDRVVDPPPNAIKEDAEMATVNDQKGEDQERGLNQIHKRDDKNEVGDEEGQ